MPAKPQPAAKDIPPSPRHVAIIMDGNGRWAAGRGLPRSAGHKKGAESVRDVIRAATKAGVAYLTLFGFSSENWKRPSGEVTDLMGLLRFYLKRELNTLMKEGVRLRIIGERSRLAPDIQDMIEAAEDQTKANAGLTLVIAISYGGRSEITNAARALAEQVAAGELDPDAIDETLFAAHLETADIPDPDLLIRTSGEQRISNFLLWQTAYAEFVVTDTLWPDFGEDDFAAAIDEFQSRDRRYGSLRG